MGVGEGQVQEERRGGGRGVGSDDGQGALAGKVLEGRKMCCNNRYH